MAFTSILNATIVKEPNLQCLSEGNHNLVRKFASYEANIQNANASSITKIGLYGKGKSVKCLFYVSNGEEKIIGYFVAGSLSDIIDAEDLKRSLTLDPKKYSVFQVISYRKGSDGEDFSKPPKPKLHPNIHFGESR